MTYICKCLSTKIKGFIYMHYIKNSSYMLHGFCQVELLVFSNSEHEEMETSCYKAEWYKWHYILQIS